MNNSTKRQARTRSDAAYEHIVEVISRGELAPGAPLNIPSLAREFEISQTPIREALARLEHTGLVRREALRGYFVAMPFTARDVKKLIEARLVVQPALAREASLRVTPDFLESLLEVIEGRGEVPSFGVEREERFFALVSAQSGNPFLGAAAASLAGQNQRLAIELRDEGGSHAATDAELRAVYDALAARDPELAASTTKHLLESSRGRALQEVSA
ncbi:GntR family transcriptional regulator [Pseudoclavibacter helvolus]|uniref:GntR family transcriptional regulator n=1 Tax=Pseudoclavibacter helvolus TaxID=255205 RepID=UPI003C75EA58